jgi:hypothetical protein
VVGGGKKAGPVASQVKVKKNIVDIKVNQVKRGYCFVIVDGRRAERAVRGEARPGRSGDRAAAAATTTAASKSRATQQTLTFVADLL